MKKLLIGSIFLMVVGQKGFCEATSWKDAFIAKLLGGGALVVDESGHAILSHKAQTLFIPASTLKIATSYCALEEAGPTYRFKTTFSRSQSGDLVVVGGGDPSLTSEEIKRVALKLASHKSFNKVVLDVASFDDENCKLDGSSNTTNPYDAPNGALVANFHTAFLEKTKNGRLTSAEPQTPLTPLSQARGSRIGVGKERMNLGRESRLGALYFGELLTSFLRESGVKVNPVPIIGRTVTSDAVLFTHESEKDLGTVIKGLLEYSTNFTANQIMLVFGAQKFGFPATGAKGKRWLSQCLSERVGWRNSVVEEGSGLSRLNKVSPSEFVALLVAFKPYRSLLHVKGPFQAKTGTLTGVNSYAGYFFTPEGKTITFAFFVNSPVDYAYKFKLARELYRAITNVDPGPLA